MNDYRIVGNFCEAEIFRDFRDQTPTRENLFLHKFLVDNESSTVPSSHRSSKLTES